MMRMTIEEGANVSCAANSTTNSAEAVLGSSNKDELRASLQSGSSESRQADLLPVIGLFGTCGGSKWREPVMQSLASKGIKYFNPVVPNWTPADGEVEAKHAASDKVVLMVVTDETEAAGSLAETGWIENSAQRHGQKAIFVVQDYHEPGKPVDPKHQANRARKLVRAHAKQAGVPIYDQIEPALEDALKAIAA